jgi:flagellar biosynthesis component FlhA
MWIFTVMSDTIIHLVLAAGVIGLIAGFVLGFIPIIGKYKLPIQIISILLFALGVYLEGGLANDKEWQAKVKEAEAKAARAEAEAAKKNTELQAALNDKGKVIKEKGDTIIKYVDRYRDREIIKEIPGPERVRIEKVIEYIENCPIPPELVNIHNDAARLNKGKEVKK